LAQLVIGTDLSVTQLAALNCLEDPLSLPVGAVIWLPASALANLETAAAAPPSGTLASIVRFEASAGAVRHTETVTFDWLAVGAAAYFYACPPDPAAACERPLGAQPVPLEYTTPEIGGFRYAGNMRYRLEVVDGDSSAVQDVLVAVTCAYESLVAWSGLQTCPSAPPESVFAAWQPFEGGIMMWFSDTQNIWVMTYTDRRLTIYPDTYVEGEADPTGAPPEGRQIPVRGFGKLWAELGGADGPLGWAVSKETGFDSRRQPAGSSFTSYITGVSRFVYAVTIPAGADAGYWFQVGG
jgi:hypothetical protein